MTTTSRTSTSARWRRGLVVLVAGGSLLAGPSATATACEIPDRGFFTFAYTTLAPFEGTAFAPAPGARPPDVLLPAINGASDQDRGLRRYDGRTGRLRWSFTEPVQAFALTGAGRSGHVVALSSGVCASMVLTARDAETSRLRWRVPAGIGSAALPDSFFVLPGVGDLSRDGWSDVALLEIAADEAGPLLVGHASGQTQPVLASWSARLTVVDGRTGRVVLRQGLGSGTGAFPMISWVPDAAGDKLAVAVPAGPSATQVSVVGARGTAWRRTLGSPLGDVALRSFQGGLLVIRNVSYGYNVLGGLVEVFDAATGTPRWSLPVGLGMQVVTGARGEIYAAMPGQVSRLDTRDGARLWTRQAADGAFVDLLGDFDGDGRADPLLHGDVPSGDANHTAVGSQAGAVLFTIPASEAPFRVGDLTGDGRDDLVTIDHTDETAPVVRLRAGDGRIVWTTTPRYRKGGLLTASAAGGVAGSVLLADFAWERPFLMLSARTGRERWRLTPP